jgi:hypothetical protein
MPLLPCRDLQASPSPPPAGEHVGDFDVTARAAGPACKPFGPRPPPENLRHQASRRRPPEHPR